MARRAPADLRQVAPGPVGRPMSLGADWLTLRDRCGSHTGKEGLHLCSRQVLDAWVEDGEQMG